jgi:hypothetical protein
MADKSRAVLGAVALFVVAPIGAAVVIGALLLFGAEPRLVFLPGHFVRARLAGFGIHAPNAVGVLTTVAVWWVILVAGWLLVRRLWRRG